MWTGPTVRRWRMTSSNTGRSWGGPVEKYSSSEMAGAHSWDCLGRPNRRPQSGQVQAVTPTCCLKAAMATCGGGAGPPLLGDLLRPVAADYLELVDEALLVLHGPQEVLRAELAVEPAQGTVGPVLHQPEQAQAQLGGVRPVQDAHRRVESEPGPARVEDEHGAAGVSPQPVGPHPGLGAAAPQVPVHHADPDPGHSGPTVLAHGDHGRLVVLLEEGTLAVGEGHVRKR